MNELNKKISVGIIVLLFLQVFSINTTAITPFTSHQVYEGLENGETLLNNIKFNDIEGHWAKEPIQEVASLSLMNGTSYRQFNPNGTLTNAQALTTLVRAIGKESEAQILGQNQLDLDVSKEDKKLEKEFKKATTKGYRNK